MKQQVVTSPKEIIFKEVQIPDCKEDEIVIKTMRIGICGRDIHVYYGEHPNTSFPVTQGHEVSGEVIKIGKKVVDFKIGDKVTFQPQIVCGQCYPCKNGLYHICDKLRVRGFQAPGAAVEYFVINEDDAIKLPDKMSFDKGAMIEPIAVACGAISKVSKIEGKNVVVLGAGPIGNLTAQTAKALGAKAVLITEINEFRLDIAKKVGIDYIVNPTKANLLDEIITAFGADKADIIFECIGLNQTVNDAIKIARKGTDIVLVGVYGENPTIDLNSIQNEELRLIGTLMYQKKDYYKAIELVESGKIKLEPLITNHFPFDKYNDAYQYIEKNKEKVMKVLIDVH